MELAMERDWQANLAAKEAARQKAEDVTGGKKSIRLPVHPCPNQNNIRVSRAYDYQCIHAQTINNVRVSRAYDYQSIHAQIIITFVSREHTITRASMPKT